MSEALDKLNAAAEAAASAAAALAEAARGVAADAATGAAPLAEVAGHGVAAATGVDPFVFRFAIFVLAIFIGYYVVWSVTPALHTPLMSVTNAISSVIVVGALVAVGADVADGATQATKIFGFIALVLASVNIFGGFLVTERMLAMYKPKEKK
ncbi:MAG: NAD(P) transhydrogenase subunit alpha [Rubrimonas sp.]|uniref:NAD(P) transhydrogenase subunit alpha n=1 Tax=Rubrimonas sp. TaxID=2036015 RepID=UPI003DCBFA61